MPAKIPYHRPFGSTRTAKDDRAYRQATSRRHLESFYNSAAWRKLSRLHKLEHPLCAECERQGRVTIAQQVHHVKDLETHPELALEWDNLESLCRSCHNGMRRK
jgi:5-methylcytosine-specific restriction protein A